MADTQITDFFLLGFQKCATTWLYHCLKEHSAIFLPQNDEIHFFDIQYYKGNSWYRRYYEEHTSASKISGDTTSSYARSQFVPLRIFEHNPKAKLIFSMRNPVDRSFSHYWHEKRKNKIGFTFEEAVRYRDVGIYDIFADWIETGFYIEHIDRFRQYFPDTQIHFLFDFELCDNSKESISRLFSFLGVDASFIPPSVDIQINKQPRRFIKKMFSDTEINLLNRNFSLIPEPLIELGFEIDEYDKGIAPDLRLELETIFLPYIIRLEKLVGKDIRSFWLKG